MFTRGSRYYDLEQVEWESPDGRLVPYVRRRFIPRTAPSAMAAHSTAQGDRLDNLTARYMGDPSQFWRVCDANRAMRPDELTETIGRRLIIPAPDAEGWSR